MTASTDIHSRAGDGVGESGHYLPGERNVPLENRIFINRNLRLDRVRALGFDMDHTLALYNRETFEQLTFDLAMDNLVEWKGYPDAIRGIEYDPNFIIRGLVVDKTYGNLLKMDNHDYVARATHGTRPLSKAERKKRYRGSRINLRSDRYQSFDTLFSMPEGALFAKLVDLKTDQPRRGPLKDVKVSQIFGDVRDCVDKVHRDGSLKSRIMADLGRYFIRDDRLASTLQRLCAGGKKVFLVTNSEHDYTHAVLSFLLNDQAGDWRSLFDLIIVNSRKPGFFTQKIAPTPIPADGFDTIYQGGHAAFVEEYLGANGDQVLYFGDHTYGDILRSKTSVGWRTAMIVQELEDEVAVNESQVYHRRELADLISRRKDIARDLDQTRLLMSVMDGMVDYSQTQANGIPPWTRGYARRQLELFHAMDGGQRSDHLRRIRHTAEGLQFLMDQTVARIRVLERDMAHAHNAVWGPLFREGNELSRFARQVREFACIYSSRVANFLNYPVNYYFISPEERMPHDV